MRRFVRIFLLWFLAVAAVWAFVNQPRFFNGGSLKPFLEWAGFPWTYAYWQWDRLKWFDRAALEADIALGVGVSIAIAGLCAWSRCRSVRRLTTHDR